MENWMKRLTAVVIFLGVGITAFAQTAERGRGFYIDAGIGYGGIIYSNESDIMVKNIQDDGFNRITLLVDVSIGWAVLQNLYLAGSFTGFADRFFKSSDYKQLNTGLYGLGVKFYPLSSKKHLQIGADLGLGSTGLVTYINGSTDTIISDPGFGMKISAAYDFDSTMTGPALLLGGDILLAFTEGETRTCFSIFAKFVYK
jgi:hypothetical protein